MNLEDRTQLHESKSFTRKLEARARALATSATLERRDHGPLSANRQELALVLEHIDRLRRLHEAQLESLLRVDCYIGTELMGMEQRTPRYAVFRFPEREKLQKRLGHLEAERRRLALTMEEKFRDLHGRLLDLVRKHDYLNI